MKKVRMCIAALVLGMCLQAPAAAVMGAPKAEAAEKSGLVKSKKKYFYYKKGKKVKNKWVSVKIKGKKQKYYFGKNGAAYTGVKKVKGKIYCFNAKGQMQKNTWYKKAYYLGNNGAAYTGIRVIDGMLYGFGANGKLDAEKTKLLQEYGKQGADAAALKAVIGDPVSADYAASCMTYEGQSGEDGIWTYDGFTIFTFRYGEKEIVWTCY
jgi:hypothetical protein